MASIRRSGGTTNCVNQRDNGQTYNYTDITGGTANTMQANVATILATHAGLAFDNITINSGVHVRRAKLVFRLDTSGTNATGADYQIYAHKVPAPPAFKATVGSGTNDLVSRFSAKTTLGTITVSRSTPYVSTERVQEFDVTTMVQEVIDQPLWAYGGRMVFLLINGKIAANPDWTTRFHGGVLARRDLWPELYVEYGNPGSDAFDVSLGIFGDSHAVCAGQAGEPRNNIPILAPTWDNVTVEEIYAGAVSENTFVGSVYGGGDQTRGYAPGGHVQDQMEDKYGDTNVLVYRKEFALGGTLLQDWWFKKFVQQASNPATDPSLPTSQPPYVYTPGQSNGPGTGAWGPIDTFLANPPSPHKRCLLWFSMLGNDLIALGKQSNSNAKIVPRGSAWNTLRTNLITKTTDIFNHIMQTWEDNDVDGYLLLPGYQNFMVMGLPYAGHMQYPPLGGAGSDDPLEREVHSTSGFGVGFAQIDEDGLKQALRSGVSLIDPTNPDDPYVLNQSTFMKTCIWYQQDIYGAFSTTAPGGTGAQWTEAQFNMRVIPGEGDHTWYRTYGPPVSRSIDGWVDTMRNIDDITVNNILIGETEAVLEASIENVLSVHPEWENNFKYRTNGRVHGPDTSYSADPTSYYAQPPRATTVRTDGIHPSSARFQVWVRDYINWLDTQVPFLPGYIPPVTNRFFLTV